MAHSCWAIVVAAGSGTRFGGPKQYEPLGQHRVLDWSIAAARATCTGIVLVVPPDRADDAEPAVDVVVGGASTRSASVRAGMAALPDDVDLVVVHDAARPRATVDLWRAIIDTVDEGADAAVPVVPVTDTIWRADGAGPVDRAELVAVQTPQGFRADKLRRAHATGADATDDASLVHAAGGRVLTVPGEAGNVKITSPADLAMMQVFFS